MKFEEISFDYYNTTFSYIKIMMEYLVKNGHPYLENVVMQEIFNQIYSDLDSDEIRDNVFVSALIEKRLMEMDSNQLSLFINNIYESYLKQMILNFDHNFETTKVFYDRLNNKMIEYSGYYGIYGEKEKVKSK